MSPGDEQKLAPDASNSSPGRRQCPSASGEPRARATSTRNPGRAGPVRDGSVKIFLHLSDKLQKIAPIVSSHQLYLATLVFHSLNNARRRAAGVAALLRWRTRRCGPQGSPFPCLLGTQGAHFDTFLKLFRAGRAPPKLKTLAPRAPGARSA